MIRGRRGQLVQEMAGFGGGAAVDSSNTVVRYVTAAVSDDAAARMRVGCIGLTLLNQSAAAVATGPEGHRSRRSGRVNRHRRWGRERSRRYSRQRSTLQERCSSFTQCNLHTVGTCVYGKLRFERIGDAGRRPGHAIRCVRCAEPGARRAHPCLMSGAFSRCCNNSHKILGLSASVLR
jgi:hypothetical protein